MEATLGDHLPLNQREQFLKDNCDHVEDIGYMRKFTPEEIRQMKDELSTVAIKINDIQIEKKHAMDVFKGRLDPLVSEKKDLLENIKLKARHVTETCYKFIDQEAGRVGFYNGKGELIEERGIYPDERQSTMFQIARTGSDD